MLCPQTCGCADPRSPLALALPLNGCGDRCVLSGAYREALAALPCEDLVRCFERGTSAACTEYALVILSIT